MERVADVAIDASSAFDREAVCETEATREHAHSPARDARLVVVEAVATVDVQVDDTEHGAALT